MESLHLIVGLGNPGAEYANTRHNAGYLLVDALAERWGGVWKTERKFHARLARCRFAGQDVLLCQPRTFMNASGRAVQAVSAFYRVPNERLFVVVDDADLGLGEIRLRGSGGTGGHHGLESVEQYLGSRDYARLRIGIGRGGGLRQITGYVLGRFSPEEWETMKKVLDRAVTQVECWLRHGVAKAMNDFNGTVDVPQSEGNGK